MSWESATITVTYDDLTDNAPKQQRITIDRKVLVRTHKNRLIDTGHAAEAVSFDLPPDEFEAIIMQHAMDYISKPLVVEDVDGDARLILPTTAILRIDVTGNQTASEGEENGLDA